MSNYVSKFVMENEDVLIKDAEARSLISTLDERETIHNNTLTGSINNFSLINGCVRDMGSADANTITYTSIHSLKGANLPTTEVYYYLQTIKLENGYITQTATRGNTSGLIYTRNCIGGTWSAWTRLVTESDLTPTLVTPTMVSGMSLWDRSKSYISGYVVKCSIALTNAITASSYVHVATMPKKPLNREYFPLIINNTFSGFGYIDTDGKVYFFTNSANAYNLCNFTYMTND